MNNHLEIKQGHYDLPLSHYFRKQDMLNRLWQLRKHTPNGYYLKRGHQATTL
ncbi:hypothetical protein [Alteromonas sp. KUL42]|uniref:hypothetical protein n=1 Tax=Alteromonas sp. KUL42 TaxID=2480797 RepID=UPI0013EF99DD|nr:hypothetical protein [Alteromonas sp. KUL42]